MVPVETRFDVVLTTNSGFPLDQNLYQAVKGMSAAAQIVVPGGQIICAAECRDGFPDQGPYRQLLCSRGSAAELLDSIESGSETVADQWQAQIQARILCAARVAVHTSCISDADLAEVGSGTGRGHCRVRRPRHWAAPVPERACACFLTDHRRSPTLRPEVTGPPTSGP